MYTLAQSLHMYTMYLKFCCFLSVINNGNRAFGECVKSFQYFVFIGCTKSSVLNKILCILNMIAVEKCN